MACMPVAEEGNSKRRRFSVTTVWLATSAVAFCDALAQTHATLVMVKHLTLTDQMVAAV